MKAAPCKASKPLLGPAYQNYPFPRPQLEIGTAMLPIFPNGVEAMSSEFSLPVVLEKINENQVAVEASISELPLLVEQQSFADVGDFVHA